MKILFISSGKKPDYLCDMLLHGLRSILGADLVDTTRPAFMYDDKGKVTMLNGYVPLVLHQYDRHAELRTNILNEFKF